MIVCAPDQVRPLTEQAVIDFENAADELYDDRGRGPRLRRGHPTGATHPRAALVTVSIGVALSSRRPRFTDPREIIAVASEMKTVAKSQPGSFVAVDRRSTH